MLLITKDQTDGIAGLRISAEEIDQLVTSRVRQWLVDPGSIYQAIPLADASPQHRLIARAGEIGKTWSELPGPRQRAFLTGLLARIDAGADQIDIHLRPRRGGVLLGVAAAPSAAHDDTQILSVPVGMRGSGREIRMLIDRSEPFATAKPNARLIKIDHGAPVQCRTPQQRRRAVCRTGEAGRRQPVLF